MTKVLLVVAALVDLAIAVLLVGVSGFVTGGGPESMNAGGFAAGGGWGGGEGFFGTPRGGVELRWPSRDRRASAAPAAASSPSAAATKGKAKSSIGKR